MKLHLTVPVLAILLTVAGCAPDHPALTPQQARTALISMLEDDPPGDAERALPSVREADIRKLDNHWIEIGPARCNLRTHRFVILLDGGIRVQEHAGFLTNVMSSRKSNAFDPPVRETRDGRTRELGAAGTPGRTGGGLIPLYVGDKSED